MYVYKNSFLPHSPPPSPKKYTYKKDPTHHTVHILMFYYIVCYAIKIINNCKNIHSACTAQ